MPAALEVDKEQIKSVAIQVGFREAARQYGIAEGTLTSWATREGWMDQVRQVQAAQQLKVERQGLQSVAAVTPLQVLAKLGDKSKLRAAKVGDNTLKAIGKRKDDRLIASAPAYLSTVNALAKVHGWGSERNTGVNVAIQVNAQAIPEA